MTFWNEIAAHIGRATGEPFPLRHVRPICGGCINAASRIGDGKREFFVKLHSAERLAMFEAESAGLRALAAARALRVPEPLCAGRAGAHSYLVMELLNLGGHLDAARTGRELAQLHRTTADTFGWHRDNTIGTTPQPNSPAADWVVFWREQRLGHQLALAARNGYGGQLQRSGERLLTRLDALIGHCPAPSLLHGDLWGGNLGATLAGQPVIFDPAVYYGDRETDLAMTELFGGFDADFQSAYRETWPLDADFAVRKHVYNLYHILNHLNLFGGSYLLQAQRTIDRLLAETG